MSFKKVFIPFLIAVAILLLFTRFYFDVEKSRPSAPALHIPIIEEKCADIGSPLHKTDPKYTDKVKYKVGGNSYCPGVNAQNRWNPDKTYPEMRGQRELTFVAVCTFAYTSG